MSKWQKLIEFKEETIRLGAVFRLPAQYPYEKVVEFMVFEPNDSAYGLGLMVRSGYKAGLTLVILPIESQPLNKRGLSTQWLIDNWHKWVYSDCAIKYVWLSEYSKIPRLPKI
jgi:hypothetical protein